MPVGMLMLASPLDSSQHPGVLTVAGELVLSWSWAHSAPTVTLAVSQAGVAVWELIPMSSFFSCPFLRDTKRQAEERNWGAQRLTDSDLK